MRRLALLASLAAMGAGFALVAQVSTSRRESPVRAPPRDHRADALAAELDTLELRIERIESGLDALQRYAEIPEVRRDLPGNEASVAAAGDGESAVRHDEDELRGLQSDAMRLAKDKDRRNEALALLADVSAWSTDPQLRAEAWLEQGNLYWASKDYTQAADVWRRAVDAVGLEQETGQTACFQLGWALSYSGDGAAAYEAAQRVTNTPGVSKVMLANARWASAVFAASSGDAPRARPLYEAMIRDYEGDPDEYYRRIAVVSRQGLSQLR